MDCTQSVHTGQAPPVPGRGCRDVEQLWYPYPGAYGPLAM